MGTSRGEGPNLVMFCAELSTLGASQAAGWEAAMTDRIDDTDTTTGKPSGPAAPVAAAEAPRQFGLAAAMALIVGSIIGVGIFNLPTSLAGYGPITLISMALTTVGALALAIMFAALSRRLPADGGPYAYARVAFGNRLGFANAWSY